MNVIAQFLCKVFQFPPFEAGCHSFHLKSDISNKLHAFPVSSFHQACGRQGQGELMDVVQRDVADAFQLLRVGQRWMNLR